MQLCVAFIATCDWCTQEPVSVKGSSLRLVHRQDAERSRAREGGRTPYIYTDGVARRLGEERMSGQLQSGERAELTLRSSCSFRSAFQHLAAILEVGAFPTVAPVTCTNGESASVSFRTPQNRLHKGPTAPR